MSKTKRSLVTAVAVLALAAAVPPGHLGRGKREKQLLAVPCLLLTGRLPARRTALLTHVRSYSNSSSAAFLGHPKWAMRASLATRCGLPRGAGQVHSCALEDKGSPQTQGCASDSEVTARCKLLTYLFAVIAWMCGRSGPGFCHSLATFLALTETTGQSKPIGVWRRCCFA